MSEDQRKDLPPVNAPNFLERVREALSINMGARGDGLDRAVTIRDLAAAGIAKITPGFVGTPGRVSQPLAGPGPRIEPVYEVDLTPPPTPTNLQALPGISTMVITHDAPLYKQGHGHAVSCNPDCLPTFGVHGHCPIRSDQGFTPGRGGLHRLRRSRSRGRACGRAQVRRACGATRGHFPHRGWRG